ncbi:FAA_hydrolase domain-containing protein [Haematococcus lacustris]|uniref:FAA_hydrolase domain-containing protein n=1 Tax=Haematococcus lacustris TaxID=44745 RepID=A0A699ZY70_HAELA|nr:FAA_hydrolase domain-containing protein [Haematococcus lacustris]
MVKATDTATHEAIFSPAMTTTHKAVVSATATATATQSHDGEPMIFLKAGSSALASGQPLVLPPWSSDVHHEVELALELGPDLQPVRGCVALDLTARDAKLKQQRWPWTLAKSFPCSTPLGTPFSLQGKPSSRSRLTSEDV